MFLCSIVSILVLIRCQLESALVPWWLRNRFWTRWIYKNLETGTIFNPFATATIRSIKFWIRSYLPIAWVMARSILVKSNSPLRTTSIFFTAQNFRKKPLTVDGCRRVALLKRDSDGATRTDSPNLVFFCFLARKIIYTHN